MMFELKVTIDEKGIETEVIEETITKTDETKKIWLPHHLENKIAELTAQVMEIEERKAILETQLKKFT